MTARAVAEAAGGRGPAARAAWLDSPAVAVAAALATIVTPSAAPATAITAALAPIRPRLTGARWRAVRRAQRQRAASPC
jgi:hypothetical protein